MAFEHVTSVRLENLSFAYDGAKATFENLTVDLPVGKNILVTGVTPGQGTSTLLKLLAVVHQPQTGKVLINGEDTSQMSFEEFLPLRMKIGYTFDYGGLFANRSLLDNMTLPLLYHKTHTFEGARNAGIELANYFGFYNKLVERPASVTGGLRKLVSVLRTLLMNPEMIVMDDPFVGVDPKSCERLIKILNERRERGELRHLFLTSRDPNWHQLLGCQRLVLADGQFDFSEVA